MTEELLAGAINPYALAEYIVGKPISWERVAANDYLEAILGRPVNELLYAGSKSPIFVGLEVAQATSEPKRLTPGELGARINTVEFADTTRSAAIGRIAAAANLPATTVAGRLLTGPGAVRGALSAALGIPSTPWTPADGEWADMGDFFEEGTEQSDPIQGALGDCWLIAGLASVAWSEPDAIAQRNRVVGTEQSQFVDVFNLRGSTGAVTKVEVSERIPVRKNTHEYIYGRSREPGEIWPAVYEKAFAKWISGASNDQPPYSVLSGGDPVLACAAVVGRPASYVKVFGLGDGEVWNTLRTQCAASGMTKRPMVAWTYAAGAAHNPGSLHYKEVNLVEWHAYSILGTPVIAGKKYVVLRNPWGRHPASGGTTWSGTTLGVKVPDAGCFALQLESFKTYFSGFGWA